MRLIALLAILTLAIPGLPGCSRDTPPAPGGLTLAAPPSGGDFSLDSADGRIATQNFRGQVVALYFGYTYCPDVCPTSLAALGSALEKLTPAELAQVQPLFISVDPERDSVARLKDYAVFFHPKLKGLTGTVVDSVPAVGEGDLFWDLVAHLRFTLPLSSQYLLPLKPSTKVVLSCSERSFLLKVLSVLDST